MTDKTEKQEAIEAAYKAGVDAVKNGANEQNCHFSHFNTQEQTDAWQLGSDEQMELEGDEE